MGMSQLKIMNTSEGYIHKYENLKRQLYNCNANIYFNQSCDIWHKHLLIIISKQRVVLDCIFLLKHFIIQQMHKYIIRGYNYIIKYFKIVPTCFRSQGIHHEGALYSAWLKLQ